MKMSGPPPKHGGSPSNASQKQAPSKNKRNRELRADFLLNFQRPSPHQRPSSSTAVPPRRSRPTGGPRHRTPVAFVRGRFVQSSFRIFVDSISPDVVEAAYDADALINWPNVHRVDLICDEHPKCPICLDEDLVVPKITKCGHVFCVPCVMRYFLVLSAANGRTAQRCPVCNEQVVPEDLTSVRFQMTRPIRDNDRTTFVLNHREASSMFVRGPCAPQPSSQAAGSDWQDDDDEALPQLPTERDPGWHFSRVVRLRSGEAQAMLMQELEALRLYRPAAIAAGDTELLPSVDASVAMLEQRLQAGAGSLTEAAEAAGEALSRNWGCCYVDVPESAGDAAATVLQSGSRAAAAEEAVEGIELAQGGAGLDYDEVEGQELQGGVDAGDGSAELAGALADIGEEEVGGETPPAGLLPSPAMGFLSSPDLSPEVEDPEDSPLARAASSNSSPQMATMLLPEPAASHAASATHRPPAAPAGGPRIISFYQVGDGRLIFLQPFFTRLLLHEYGGRWDQLPSVLAELRVERLQEITITEEARKRYRFLAHLPLGSPVSLAEVDLRDRLSRETKERFEDEFAKRRQQRLKEQQRAKKQERHSKLRAAEDEETYYRSLNLVHPSVQIAPPTAEDFAVPLPSRAPATTRTEDDTVAEATGEQRPDAEGEPQDDGEEDTAAPTLADKIKGRIAAQVQEHDKDHFPNLGGPSSGSGGPAASAWGRGVGSSRAAGSRTSGRDGQQQVDAEGPRLTTPMEEQPTFGEALEAALRRSAAGRPSSSAPGRPSSSLTEVEPQEDEGNTEAVGAAGAKKKKGRASKATKIHLFG